MFLQINTHAVSERDMCLPLITSAHEDNYYYYSRWKLFAFCQSLCDYTSTPRANEDTTEMLYVELPTLQQWKKNSSSLFTCSKGSGSVGECLFPKKMEEQHALKIEPITREKFDNASAPYFQVESLRLLHPLAYPLTEAMIYFQIG